MFQKKSRLNACLTIGQTKQIEWNPVHIEHGVREIAFFDHWDDLSTLSACSTIITWKTLKDYLQSQGVAISPLTPRMVIKEAFAAGIISDGQIWIDMLDHRNFLSHTYDEEVLDEVMTAIEGEYMSALNELHTWFSGREA